MTSAQGVGCPCVHPNRMNTGLLMHSSLGGAIWWITTSPFMILVQTNGTRYRGSLCQRFHMLSPTSKATFLQSLKGRQQLSHNIKCDTPYMLLNTSMGKWIFLKKTPQFDSYPLAWVVNNTMYATDRTGRRVFAFGKITFWVPEHSRTSDSSSSSAQLSADPSARLSTTALPHSSFSLRTIMDKTPHSMHNKHDTKLSHTEQCLLSLRSAVNL